eukprot:PDM69675.1 PHD finger motif containing protein [Pristionchus pacificus]
MSYEAVPCMVRAPSQDGTKGTILGVIIRPSSSQDGSHVNPLQTPPGVIPIKGAKSIVIQPGSKRSLILSNDQIQKMMNGRGGNRISSHSLSSPMVSASSSLISTQQHNHTPIQSLEMGLSPTSSIRINCGMDGFASSTPDSGIQSVPATPPQWYVQQRNEEKAEDETKFDDMPRLRPIDEEEATTSCSYSRPPPLDDSSSLWQSSECESSLPSSLTNTSWNPEEIATQLLSMAAFDPQKIQEVTALMLQRSKEDEGGNDKKAKKRKNGKSESQIGNKKIKREYCEAIASTSLDNSKKELENREGSEEEVKRSEEEDDKDDAHRLSRYRLAIKRRLAQKLNETNDEVIESLSKMGIDKKKKIKEGINPLFRPIQWELINQRRINFSDMLKKENERKCIGRGSNIQRKRRSKEELTETTKKSNRRRDKELDNYDTIHTNLIDESILLGTLCCPFSCDCTKGRCLSSSECIHRSLNIFCTSSSCSLSSCSNRLSSSTALFLSKGILKTNQPKKANQFLGEIVGEVISVSTMTSRLSPLSVSPSTSIKAFSFTSNNFIDCTWKGSITRWESGTPHLCIFSRFPLSSNSVITADLSFLTPLPFECNCSHECCKRRIASSLAVPLHQAKLPSYFPTLKLFLRRNLKTFLRKERVYSSLYILYLLIDQKFRRMDGKVKREFASSLHLLRKASANEDRGLFMSQITRLLEITTDLADIHSLSCIRNRLIRESDKKTEEVKEKKKCGRSNNYPSRYIDTSYLDAAVPVGSYNPDEWKVGENNDAVRCICGVLEEDGEMMECDECHYWLHSDCIQRPLTNAFKCPLCVEGICTPHGDVILNNQPNISFPHLNICSLFSLKLYGWNPLLTPVHLIMSLLLQMPPSKCCKHIYAPIGCGNDACEAVCERIKQIQEYLAQAKNINSLKLWGLGFSRVQMTMDIFIFHAHVPVAPDDVTLEGCIYYKALENRKKMQIRVSECVYVKRMSENHKKILRGLEQKKGKVNEFNNEESLIVQDEDDAIPPRSILRVFRVERLFESPGGHRFLFGFYYARPHETFCDESRMFHPNEVFATPLYDTLPLDAVVGKCVVMETSLFCEGRPIFPSYKENDVLVCEYQLDRNQRHFDKCRHSFKLNTEPYAFQKFERTRTLQRFFTPFSYSPMLTQSTVNASTHILRQPTKLARIVESLTAKKQQTSNHVQKMRPFQRSNDSLTSGTAKLLLINLNNVVFLHLKTLGSVVIIDSASIEKESKRQDTVNRIGELHPSNRSLDNFFQYSINSNMKCTVFREDGTTEEILFYDLTTDDIVVYDEKFSFILDYLSDETQHNHKIWNTNCNWSSLALRLSEVTGVCAIDKKGILATSEPVLEKIFIVHSNEEGDTNGKVLQVTCDIGSSTISNFSFDDADWSHSSDDFSKSFNKFRKTIGEDVESEYPLEVECCRVKEKEMYRIHLRGSPSLILPLCLTYWDGTEVKAMNDKVIGLATNFASRHTVTSHCVAISCGSSIYEKSSNCCEYTEKNLENKFNQNISSVSEFNISSDTNGMDSIEQQTFLALTASQEQALPFIFEMIESLKSSCIRFILFSKENQLRSRIIGEKLGLEAGWNCHISLKNETSKKAVRILNGKGRRESCPNGKSIHSLTTSIPSLPPNMARLPIGIEHIRPHLERVDNVPLLVSLFTDCTVDATREMIDILHENDECQLVIGSLLSPDNMLTLMKGIVSIGIYPLSISACQYQSEEIMDEGGIASLSTDLIIHQSQISRLPYILSFSRQKASLFNQYISFYLISSFSISLHNLFTLMLKLPFPISSFNMILVTFVIHPLLTLSILFHNDFTERLVPSSTPSLLFRPINQFFFYHFPHLIALSITHISMLTQTGQIPCLPFLCEWILPQKSQASMNQIESLISFLKDGHWLERWVKNTEPREEQSTNRAIFTDIRKFGPI